MRIPWNKYEVALLINLYIRISEGKVARKEGVCALSSLLRNYAKNNGVNVDTIYRNENGISMRLEEINHIFNNEGGLKNTSKLFCDMVDLYKSDQAEFAKILSEAEKTFVVNIVSKEGFFSQLSSDISPTYKYLYRYYFSNIEKFCVKKGFITKSLFEIKDLKLYQNIKQRILSDAKFKKHNKNNWSAVCNFLDLFEAYCLNFGAFEKSIPQPSVSKEKDNDNDSSSEYGPNCKALLKTIEYLKTRYTVKLSYDHFSNPGKYNNDILYKAYNDIRDVIWIYHIKNSKSNYVSVEFEPEYIKDLAEYNDGFYKEQLRNFHPCLKLFFTDYDEIKDSLIKICDAIDSFFDNKPISEQKQSTTQGNKNQDEFYNWLSQDEGLSASTCRVYVSVINSSEKYAQDHGFDSSTIFSDDKEEAVKTIFELLKNDEFVKSHSGYLSMLKRYLQFLGVDAPDTTKPRAKSEQKSTENKALNSDIEAFVKSYTDVVEISKIYEKFSGESDRQIRIALETADVIPVLDRCYHRDNIEDFGYMADTLLDAITHHFKANGNYISAYQLFREVHQRLDNFFFFNGAFESQAEVYCLAEYLFKRANYKDNCFVFYANFHIWKEKPDYPMDFGGLLVLYCREHNGVFSRSEAEDYLKDLGAGTPAPTLSNILYKTGWNSFLQYEENRFVLCESLNINNDFLASLRNQIELLLEDEDYVSFGDISEYFYSTLPQLPAGVVWGPLLLESIVVRYDIGYNAIYAGDSDLKTIPAALAKKNSAFRAFGDIVWNELSNDYDLPMTISYDEFRQYLLKKGFIHGTAKYYTAHKTVEGDLRFLWNDENTNVTVSNA